MSNRKTNRKGPTRYNQPPVTIAEAVRDIFIRAIDRGVFIPLMFGLFVLLSIYKMDSADLKSVYSELLTIFLKSCAIGWTAFAVSVCAGIGIGFLYRSKTRREEHRIGIEKSKLHEQGIGQRLSSSARK